MNILKIVCQQYLTTTTLLAAFCVVSGFIILTKPVHAAICEIDQKGQTFAQADITISKGDTIRYQNHTAPSKHAARSIRA